MNPTQNFMRMIQIQGEPKTAKGDVSKQGIPEGEWTYWHDNGMKMAEGKLYEGKPHGPWKTYDDDGSLQSESFWNSGKPAGRWVVYDQKGNIDRLYHHDHAELDTDKQRFKLEKPEMPM